MSRPVMYIFVNGALGMSPGKLAAQAAHAAVEAYRISETNALDDWYLGGHYTKLVMKARHADHLMYIQKYLEERGFRSKLIIDEGITEIDPHVPTALGVEVVDKEIAHVAATFSTFELYRDKIKVTMEIER